MSLFPNSVYSSPGVLQGALSAPAAVEGGAGVIPNNLVVSTLFAQDGISTLGGLSASAYVQADIITCSSINATGGTMIGLSSITAVAGGNSTISFSGGALTNIGAITLNEGAGAITGVSTITGQGNSINAPAQFLGVTNMTISTINSAQVPIAKVIAQFATQEQSTFNTNSMVEGVPPTFTILNSNALVSGHAYQLSFTGQAAMISAVPSPPPAGDNFSWSLQSGATNIKLYQVPSTELASQSMGPLSSIRESVTSVFTAGATQLLIVGGYQAGAGTNYQYPSTSITFTGPATLVDLGVPAPL